MKPVTKVLAAAGSLAILATTPALADRRGISEREMVQKFVRIFDRLDHNHTGRISYKWVRKIENRGSSGHRGHHDNPRVRVSFGDENFRIVFGTGGGGRHGGGYGYVGPINSRTFHIYDLNGDRMLYRKELRRAVKIEFRDADRNGDGYLSQRELNKSNWYRNSHYRGHARYTPDYRRDRYYRDDYRRRDHRHRDTHRHRNNDRYRDGYREGRHDERKADRREDRREAERREARREERRREERREARRDDRRDDRKEARREERRDDRREARREERRKEGKAEKRRERREEDRDGRGKKDGERRAER